MKDDKMPEKVPRRASGPGWASWLTNVESVTDYFTGGAVFVPDDRFGLGFPTIFHCARCKRNSAYGRHDTMGIFKVGPPTQTDQSYSLDLIALFSNCPDPRGPNLVKRVYNGSSVWKPESNLDNFFVCKAYFTEEGNNPELNNSFNPFYTPWIEFGISQESEDPYRLVVEIRGSARIFQKNDLAERVSYTLPSSITIILNKLGNAEWNPPDSDPPAERPSEPLPTGWTVNTASRTVRANADITYLVGGIEQQISYQNIGTVLIRDAHRTIWRSLDIDWSKLHVGVLGQ